MLTCEAGNAGEGGQRGSGALRAEREVQASGGRERQAPLGQVRRAAAQAHQPVQQQRRVVRGVLLGPQGEGKNSQKCCS